MPCADFAPPPFMFLMLHAQVGDQQQLPPTVTSQAAAAGGLALTPFVRLVKAGIRPLLLTDQVVGDPLVRTAVGVPWYAPGGW